MLERRTGPGQAEARYIRAEEAPQAGARTLAGHAAEEAASASEQGDGGVSEQELAVYESFVLGMLTNLESLTLPRMHNMLKMFMVSPAYDKNERELAQLLQRLAARDKIVCEGGVYRKKKA